MTLKKAIDRLSWRFRECKTINPTQLDVDAFNEILEYIEDTKKETLSQNLVAAKLYIAVYKRTIEHYSTTVLDPIPQKEVHKFLNKPIEWHYENFTDFLNNQEWLSKENDNLVDPAWTIEDVTNNLNIQITECLRKYSEN